MLTQEDAQALSARLDELRCTDPAAGDGLFAYVFMREPSDQVARYESHMRRCEFCRLALKIYRYKRGVAELLSKGTKECHSVCGPNVAQTG